MTTTKRADTTTFFKSDRAILIICISIALIFWLLVKLSQSFNAMHQCEIQYELPEGKTFASLPPSKINSQLYGRGWDLLSYYFSGTHSIINFQLDNQSSQTISSSQLKDRIRGGVASVEVIELDIDYITIALEDELSRKVPVRLNQELSFAADFQARQAIVLNPDSISITGPQTIIDTIDFWPTVPLILTDLKSSTREVVELVMPKVGSALRIKPTATEAQIEVEQFTQASLFVPITIKNAPDSLRIFPDKIKLNCIVGLSQYKSLKSKLFTLEADLQGIPLNAQNNTVPLNLIQQPEFVRQVNFSPKAVEFFFVKRKEITVDSTTLSTQ
ncbi:MAG: YbbR-like domain-containing protein [Bacteroidota bacterium]